MTSRSDTRRRLLLLSGGLLFLVALYGLMGFLQAVMLFTGERALRNSNIWSSLFLVAAALATACFVSARQRRSQERAHWLVTRLVLLCASLLVSVSAAWRVVSDYIAVDSCLDLGGSFNYVRSVCDFSASHPSVSAFAWRGFFIACSLVFACPVVLAAWRRRSIRGSRHANAL